MELVRESIVWWYALIGLVLICFIVLLRLWRNLKRKKKKTSLLRNPYGYRGYIGFGLGLCPIVFVLLAMNLWGGFYRMDMPDAQTIRVRYAPPRLSQKLFLEDIEKIVVVQDFHPGNNKKKARVVSQIQLMTKGNRKITSIKIYETSIVQSVVKGFEHLNVPVEVTRKKKGLF